MLKNLECTFAAPESLFIYLTILHSEWPKLNGVLVMLSAIGLKEINSVIYSTSYIAEVQVLYILLNLQQQLMLFLFL